MKKHSKINRDNKTFGYRVFSVFNVLFMILVILLMFLPYLHIVAKALNEGTDSMRGGILFWPRIFTLENIKMIIGDPQIYHAAYISVLRVVLGVVLGLMVQFGAAYAFTKRDLPGKNAVTIMMMIPMFFSAGMIPGYMLYAALGFLNNFWVYIIPGLFSFYNAVIIRTFIQSTIPSSLEESAYVDGANELVIFFKIILPLCKPILATVGLWIAVGHWNDWTTTLMYCSNKTSLHTLQYKMMEVVKESERLQKMIAAAIQNGQLTFEDMPSTTSEAVIAAQIVVTTIPIICVYPFVQKHFVKGVMVGAIKG